MISIHLLPNYSQPSSPNSSSKTPDKSKFPKSRELSFSKLNPSL